VLTTCRISVGEDTHEMALMKLESWSYIRKRYLWPLADVIGYRPGRLVAEVGRLDNVGTDIVELGLRFRCRFC
jgi:hypothetical protein